MIIRLLRPWVIAAGSSFVAYCLAKSQKGSNARLREAKMELIEQQRTIDRLRAEIGRARHERQQAEEKTQKQAEPTGEKAQPEEK